MIERDEMEERVRKRKRIALWTGLAACCCVGCSQQTDRVAVHPVHGKVLYDGKPVGGAMVVLHPLAGAASTDVRPLGYTKEDGSFALATFQSNDGAPAGPYVATVEWRVRSKGTEDEQIVVPNKLPPRYGSPHSSKLAIQVVAGANELQPFQLSR